jgi:hypothetical protein
VFKAGVEVPPSVDVMEGVEVISDEEYEKLK